jgi:hypothetical protein
MNTTESILPDPEPDARVRFSNSPVLVSVRNRVPWRTATTCLILSRFVRQQARLDHLHLVTWALETDGTRELFKVWLSGVRPMDRSTVRVDPELNVTITLARGLELVDVTGTRKVALTEKGKQLAGEMTAQAELLQVEKSYLRGLGNLSESRLQNLFKALAQ